MVFSRFSFLKRNVFLYIILMFFALTTHAQSLEIERLVHTGWTLVFEVDNKTQDTTISYTASSGETLTVQNSYSDADNLLKSYSFNSGQAEVVIGTTNGQRSFETSPFSGFTENDGVIDFKEYQPLVDEYQTALFQTLLGFNSQRESTIDLISNFYPHVNTRTDGAACASVVFAYITALINEEIQCSIPFNGAACTAAISTALGALAAVVSVCELGDDDDNNGGSGSGGSAGGSSGGSGGGSGGPATIEIQGGGSGDTGGNGGGSGGFQCVYDGEAIVCTTYLN